MRIYAVCALVWLSGMLASVLSVRAQDTMPSGAIPPSLVLAPRATDVLFVGDTLGCGQGDDPYTPPCNPDLRHYWRRGDLPNNRIRILIPTTRFYWNTQFQAAQEALLGTTFFDPATELLRPQAIPVLTSHNLLPTTVTLSLRVYDVDSDLDCANVPPCFGTPEVDVIYVNDFPISTAVCGSASRTPVGLTGKNNKWSTVSVEVPIQYIKLPMAPGTNADNPNVPPTRPIPAINLVEIAVSTGANASCWGLACNWATIGIDRLPQNTPTPGLMAPAGGQVASADPPGPKKLVRPVLLAYGWSGDLDSWDDYVVWMTNDGMPYYTGWDAGYGATSIDFNAEIENQKADRCKTKWGADIINIIAHSKGGLDSRQMLAGRKGLPASRDDIETLVQLDTPNQGSYWATVLIGLQYASLGILGGFPTDALLSLRPRWIARNFNYSTSRRGLFNSCYQIDYLRNTHTNYRRIYGTAEWVVSYKSALYPWQVREVNNEAADDGCKEPRATVDVRSYVQLDNGRCDTGHKQIHKTRAVFKKAINLLQPNFYTEPIAGIFAVAPEARPPKLTVGASPLVASLGSSILAAHVGATVAPPENLPLFMEDDLDSTQTIAQTTRQHEGGSRLSDPFLVQNVDTLGVAFSVFGPPDPDFTTSLQDPNGVVIDASTVATYPGASIAEIPFVENMQPPFVYRITNPINGTWRARTTSSPDGVVTTTANASSPTLFLATLSQYDYPVGSTVAARATFATATTPLLGASIQAILVLADASHPTTSLLDDGLHDDGAANDGEYGGNFGPVFVPGEAVVSFHAQSGNIVRVNSQDIHIVPDYAHLMSFLCASDSAISVDTDHDGLFNTLKYDLPVLVNQAGHYQVSASLFGANDALIDRVAYNTMFTGLGPWAVGAHTVPMRFAGDVIHDSGINGPFRLGAVSIVYLGDGTRRLFTVASYDTLCFTGPLTAVQFQRPRISIPGPNSDVTVDAEPDGKANVLDVTLGVDVTRAGTYDISASLFDRCDSYIASTSKTRIFNAGLNSVTLEWDGYDIARHRSDGPFVVRQVWASLVAPDDSLCGLFDDVHSTSPYAAQDFQGYVVTGTVLSSETLQPVIGATIDYTYLCLTLSLFGGHSDGQGGFALGGLRPGVYHAWATPSGATAAVPGTEQAQALGDTVTFTVTGDTTITLLVHTGPTAVDASPLPQDVSLGPVVPNPTSLGADVRFALPSRSAVRLTIFDVRGRVIRRLLNEVRSPGRHVAAWDGRTEAGGPAPSGVYFAQLVAGDRTLRQRIVKLR